MDALERWATLPEDVKASILDKHRNWNVEHVEWWDSTYEMFKEDMKDIGIRVDNMYFSGFWSQGDGACFEGKVEDWSLFLPTLGIDDKMLAEFMQENSMFSCRHTGHYYHEQSVGFDYLTNLPYEWRDEEAFNNQYSLGDNLRDAVQYAVLSRYDENLIEKTIPDVFRDHMRTLYRRLEEEYEYLTSDECILKTLHANEMLDELIDEATEYEYE